MKQKKEKQTGFILLTLGLLIMLISSIIYYSFFNTDRTSPSKAVNLDLSNKEVTKTTDVIYVKAKVKNGTQYEIKHTLKNTGKRDITRITIDSTLLQKKKQNEAQFILIDLIKYGNQLYNPAYFINLDFDQNRDNEISLYELSLKLFDIGSLVKNKERELIIKGKYRKGLPPFNSDNEEASILLDLSYRLK